MTNTFPKEEFEVIFQDNHSYLIGIACKYVMDPNKAYDIVQDVFIKLNRQDPNKFRELNNLRGWLNTVCRNTACKYLRKNKKYVELDEEKDKFRLSDDLDPLTNVETAEEQMDNKDIILKFLEKLGKKQKQCVVLRYFHNKSYIEIAKEMNITDSCVGYNINAGIAKLKMLMENHLKNERNKSRIGVKKP